MKTIFFLVTIMIAASPVWSADVSLSITVPDAWVQDTIAAINSVFPGREQAGMTNKQWVEHQLRQYLKKIVVMYKNRKGKEDALESVNFTEITEEDVPIAISE